MVFILCISRTISNIPPRRNRRKSYAFSQFLYRYHNPIGRVFGKLKHARGLATRRDKRADNFLAAIKPFSAYLWISAYEFTAS
ncbi:transposase [Altererythrobacter sp. SALINAS58]|nr:transposase [Alteripontixanthobacter muriae]